ncbi:MAG: T9SS type A sorting domain-containing protein, partial [Rhodothermaceae bacterium]|nr:T9SS type A sorting domain-containing protein [Rhodothermaceae bacterium]
GMTLGPDGQLYVGSFLSHEVLRFDGETGEFIDAFVVENTGGIRYPYTLLFGPNNNLYVGHQSSIVLQFDGDSGHFMDHFAAISTSEDSNVTFWVIAFGPDGLLYAYDNSSSIVHRFHGRTGDRLDSFITLENGNLNGPFGIAFAPDGALFVTGFLWNNLIRVAPSGAINTRFFRCCTNWPRSPFDIVFDDRNRVYVSSFEQDKVVRFDALTGAMLDEYIIPGSGGLDGASGMVISEDGFLYVGSIFTDEILRYDLESGEFIDVFVEAESGGLDAPHGVHFGPDGHLYVGSYFTDSILRFHKDTGEFINAFVTEGSGGLDAPQDHVFGPDGNLYVTSLFTSEVLEYNGINGNFVGAFVDVNEGGLDGPRGLAFGSDNLLYVSSFDTDQVLRFTGPSEKRSTSAEEYIESAYTLSSNFPNPFSASTRISYSLEQSTQVELLVFDTMGRQVDVLVSAYQSAGSHTISYIPDNLPSGLYFYRLQTTDFVETKQMMVVR